MYYMPYYQPDSALKDPEIVVNDKKIVLSLTL